MMWQEKVRQQEREREKERDMCQRNFESDSGREKGHQEKKIRKVTETKNEQDDESSVYFKRSPKSQLALNSPVTMVI